MVIVYFASLVLGASVPGSRKCTAAELNQKRFCLLFSLSDSVCLSQARRGRRKKYGCVFRSLPPAPRSFRVVTRIFFFLFYFINPPSLSFFGPPQPTPASPTASFGIFGKTSAEEAQSSGPVHSFSFCT